MAPYLPPTMGRAASAHGRPRATLRTEPAPEEGGLRGSCHFCRESRISAGSRGLRVDVPYQMCGPLSMSRRGYLLPILPEFGT